MLLQATETTRLARLIVAERVQTKPVPDFEPTQPEVGRKRGGTVAFIATIFCFVVRFSDSWKLLGWWVKQSLREQSV